MNGSPGSGRSVVPVRQTRAQLFLDAIRPCQSATLIGILVVAWALAGAFARETPEGAIRGRVTFNDVPKPEKEYDSDGREIPRQHKVGERNTPLPNVELTLERKNDDEDKTDDEDATGDAGDLNDEAHPTRYAVSGQGGKFSFSHVPAGIYLVSASSRAHNTRNVEVTVDEGGVTGLDISLDRSEDELKMRQHQRVYGTRDKQVPSFSVSGYANANLPKGRDALQMTVYATRLSDVMKDADAARALEQVGSSYDAPDKLPPTLLRPSGSPGVKPLLSSSVPIAADREGFFYQKLPVGKLKTGLYLVDIAHAGHTACGWLVVTDTALILKQAQGESLAYAVDLQSGTPISGAEIRAYRNGKILRRAQTDANGLARINAASHSASNRTHAANDSDEDTAEDAGKDSTRLTFVAVRGEDEAVIARDNSDNESADRYAIHAYTDRPIYRPGQRIAWKGIVRKEENKREGKGGEPVQNPYSVPKGLPVTVELKDPAGERVFQTETRTNGYGSVFGTADLNAEAPTGVYSLVVSPEGGQPHTQDIVIASYRKPEFSVSVAPDKKRYARGETVTMQVNGTFYFGAPVAGAKVKYEVYAAPDWSAEFPDDYNYDPEEDGTPTRFRDGESYYGEAVTKGTTTLDENGRAIIAFDTNPRKKKDEDKKASDDSSDESDEYAPQEQIYTTSVTVIDSSGGKREVSEQGEARVAAGDFRLSVSPDGYVALPGTPTNVVVTARDGDGKPVSNVAVTVEARFQERKKGNDEYHYKPLSNQTVTTGADGRAVTSVTPTTSGEVELRAKATDGRGHAIRATASVWAATEQGGDIETEYADLSLLTDKRRYNPGDTARVLVNASRAGESVLLTVEGERIYSTQLVSTGNHSTVVRVPVRAEYGPNVYLSACYVREKHYAHSEIPLRVSTPQSELKVTVRADREQEERPESRSRETAEAMPVSAQGMTNAGAINRAPTALPRYAPGERITYAVTTTDAQNRPVPCELSFGVVDESIYALREDDPKAMREAFYPRRGNSVSTSYSFAVEYLGDADKAEPKITARKKFPDTAYWNPDLRTDASGRATVSFLLPDNLTTWRATATAHSLTTQIGRATEKALSTKDFLVRVETPRFLTQRDESQIIAVVHNDTGATQSVRVALKADNLTVNGAASQPMTIEAGKTGQAVWPIRADGYGPAHYRVTAWTGTNASGEGLGTGTRRVYTDGVEGDLPIRAHGREAIQTFAGEAGGTRPESEVIRVDPNAVPGLSRLTVRVTPSVSGALLPAVEYLTGFPYGCVEQTMSRFVPDLLVQRVLGPHGLTTAGATSDTKRMVQTGLLRLYRFQKPDGGAWGWWEHDSPDAWMTAYVLTGLAEAQRDGYNVSRSVWDNGRKAARKLAGKGNTLPDNRAFLLYALALTSDGSDKADLLALRGQIPSGNRHAPGAAYLALADTLLGQNSQTALDELLTQSVTDGALVHWTAQGTGANWDDISTTAIALRALLATRPDDPRVEKTLRWLMLQRTGDYWMSTRDTAFVLAAFCDYVRNQPSYNPGGSVTIKVNGAPVRTLDLTPGADNEREITVAVPASKLRPDKNDITLERSGGTSPVFYTVQFRQTVAGNDLPSQSASGVTIEREYLRVKAGQSGGTWNLTTEPTQNKLAVGDRVRVRLTINSPRDLDYVLVEDPFPSGCEPNERGDASEISDWTYWWSSVDVRDDRIAFFITHLPKGKRVIEYNLRASTPGKLGVLPTLVQPMYAPDVRAETREAKLEIKP